MAVEVDVVYEGSLRCVATHGPSQDRITTDAPTDNGGRGAAFSPTDLVATALATCVGTVMGLAANRAGFGIDGTRLHVTKVMTQTGSRRIARLELAVSIPGGGNLAPEQRTRLESAAGQCPVKNSLHPDVEVTMKFSYL